MPSRQPLSLLAKLRLAARIWVRFVLVKLALLKLSIKGEPLPAFVVRLGAIRKPPRRPYSPATLSRAVHRSLRLGRRRPRCLVNALVLFRLLREQGDPAQLVIGLPESATDERAHAWVELRNRDVGPPPGRAGHHEMARLP